MELVSRFSGKVRVASEQGFNFSRFPNKNARVRSSEEGHGCRVSPAPVAERGLLTILLRRMARNKEGSLEWSVYRFCLLFGVRTAELERLRLFRMGECQTAELVLHRYLE